MWIIMNERIVVTAGEGGPDIDVLACVAAYAELLALEGKEAIPVIPGNFTSSVTPSVLKWGAKYETNYVPVGSEKFVLVDISNPERFPDFVNLDHVSEIYDHRYGHEEYWKEKLRENSHIEMVGACGTLIWEEFKKRGKSNEITLCSARLLLASIVSNTLNFKLSITTERDKTAYAELKEISDLPDNWVISYFAEQEKTLLSDFKKYLQADTVVTKAGGIDCFIGQLELWNTDKVFAIKREEIDSVMEEHEPLPWMVNIVDISKGVSYLYSKSENAKKIINDKMQLSFEDDIATTKELMLRKQLRKILN